MWVKGLDVKELRGLSEMGEKKRNVYMGLILVYMEGRMRLDG